MPNRAAANQSAPTHQSSPTPSAAGLSIKQGQTEWHLDPTKSTLPELQHRDTLLKPADAVSTMLLPRGYPHTVSHGYVGYTSWLAAGLFAHSFTVMVSTNALLSGFFAEMSAASWLMKDLLPPLVAGTLASRIRTLEANPKRWLGAACFANSLFVATEFLIPHLLPKETWMVLAICTNVGKMVGYLVIGASRAVLQKTLATGDNLGEITTKLGTLGMLMHCFGSATALTLIHYLGFWGQLGAISAGAAVGFYAPMRASQCVVMPTVTIVSLRRLVKRWAEHRVGLPTTPASSAAEAVSDSGPASGAESVPLAWQCPSPEQLHEELAARWSFAYSLRSRANVWREVFLADSGVFHIVGMGSDSIALHVAPALHSAADVAAVAGWREDLRAAGVDVPSGWTLGAGGDGRLLLLYSTSAKAADVIEGFAVAWTAAHRAAAALSGGREASEAGLREASLESLSNWRHNATQLYGAMDDAGWQCAACCADDVSRRVDWAWSEAASR